MAREDLLAEVEHWKAHAKEAGDGFTAVSKTAARISARNVELVEALDRIMAFAGNLSCERTGLSGCDNDDCCATSQLRAVIRNSRDGA